MILTVGHSTQSYEAFRSLISKHGVTAIADVRSMPFSRHTPQFSQTELKRQLKNDGIAYVFLGNELGGRPNKANFMVNGIADYEKMAESAEFYEGLERVIAGSQRFQIALMCAERDPLDCHRCLLVGRALYQQGQAMAHILSDGEIVSHSEIESKLIRLAKQDPAQADFFASDTELLDRAYRLHALRVAYAEPRDDLALTSEHTLVER